MHLSFVRTRLQDVIQLCLRGQRIGRCSVIQDISVGEPSANILLHPTDLLHNPRLTSFIACTMLFWLMAAIWLTSISKKTDPGKAGWAFGGQLFAQALIKLCTLTAITFVT